MRTGKIQSGRPTIAFAMQLTTLFSLLFISIVSFSGNVASGEQPESADEKSRQPNVVFILADDLGWRDLSNEGSTFYESPHIDRIAGEGMKFTRGYATCQVCSPSRASIMTGKYPARLNITDYMGAPIGAGWKRNTRLLPARYERDLPHADTSLAEAFRESGYRTFFAGKWHLGREGSWPQDHGFEFNVGGHRNGSPPGGFFSPYNNPMMEDGPVGECLPIRLGTETAAFIEEHKDEPFFAFLSFYSVHAPIQTTEELWKKYRDKAAALDAPQSRFIVDRTSPVRQVQDHPVYAGMVESMDDAVGIVLAKLDELGLSENTVIVFTSDNGGVSAGDGKATSNLPLRGGKGRQWEGGIREPFYIKWNEAGGGQTCATPVTGTDFYPTLMELAGIPAKPQQHVDGVSLVPLLKGESIDDRPLFWHYPHYGNQGGNPSSIIMRGDWKLINYHESGNNELYNITEDIGEQHDIASQHTERVSQMLGELNVWLKDVDARYAIVNPDFDLAKHREQQVQTMTEQVERLEKEAAGFLQPDFVPRRGWWEKTGGR